MYTTLTVQKSEVDRALPEVLDSRVQTPSLRHAAKPGKSVMQFYL